MHGAVNRAVSAKAPFLLPPPALNLLFGATQGGQAFSCGGAQATRRARQRGLAAYPRPFASERLAVATALQLRYSAPANSRLSRPLAPHRNPTRIPAGARLPASRRGGSEKQVQLRQEEKAWQQKPTQTRTTAGLRPAPQRPTLKQVETQSNHPASKGETP